MVQILTDLDLTRLLTREKMVSTMEQALEAHAAGSLIAPPRFSVETPRGGLVFTAGAETERAQVLGFRVYDTFASASPDRTQLLAVYDGETGGLRGLVVGILLGALRTAAINAVAIKHMARPDARILGVLGSGFQARRQVQMALAVRPFEEVRAYSPTVDHAAAFATEMNASLDIPVIPGESAEDVVRRADVLIVATTSPTPVFEPGWLRPGTHVNTIGPKFRDMHEISPEVAGRSAVVATDSLEQVDAYPRPFFLADTPDRERMVELGEIVAGRESGRPSRDDVTLFCSVGLAGTEVVLADAALTMARLE
ncbi:MAG: ornithine cyclodeaminase family protein [Chloroflexi bacterium]|nr:MAG: ornithine cyclodeaminase family protein [Chloroflexota bacterium]